MPVFESEREMQEVASETLPDFLRRDSNTEVIREFEYATGRTDLVLLDISEAYWNRRMDGLNLTTPIREKSYLQSFLHLHLRDPITPSYFLDIGAQDKRKKKQALDWLSDNGYVERLTNGKVTTAKRFRRHITTSIAVELKLYKWKEALQQAKRGSSFTQYQYVAIDKEHVDRAKDNLDYFVQSNVGLISIDEGGDCELHFMPERNSPISTLHQWRLNEESIDSLG